MQCHPTTTERGPRTRGLHTNFFPPLLKVNAFVRTRSSRRASASSSSGWAVVARRRNLREDPRQVGVLYRAVDRAGKTMDFAEDRGAMLRRPRRSFVRPSKVRDRPRRQSHWTGMRHRIAPCARCRLMVNWPPRAAAAGVGTATATAGRCSSRAGLRGRGAADGGRAGAIRPCQRSHLGPPCYPISSGRRRSSDWRTAHQSVRWGGR